MLYSIGRGCPELETSFSAGQGVGPESGTDASASDAGADPYIRNMKKNFDNWNKRKKEINDEQPNFYRARDIRWCSLGINIGFEQDGTSELYRRPVLVIKGFSRHVCLVVPLTTSTKENPYHLSVGMVADREAFAILSQIRLIDTKRLHDPLGILDQKKFEKIRKAIRDLI